MSWFDSSFTFAKTALNQAQKSIDKVLDIKDAQLNSEINDLSGTPQTASHSSTTPPSAQATPTHQTPLPSQSSLQSKQSQKSRNGRQSTETSSSANTSTPGSNPSESGFGSSTWGGMDSFWSPSFSSPAPSKKGDTVESPQTMSLADGRVRPSKSVKSAKSSTTPANKGSVNGSQKLDATPTMTSTPLAEVSKSSKRQKDKASSSRRKQEQQLSPSPSSPPILSPSPIAGGGEGPTPPSASDESPRTQSITADSAPQPSAIEATDSANIETNRGKEDHQSLSNTEGHVLSEVEGHPASTGGVSKVSSASISGEGPPDDATPTLSKAGEEDHTETPSAEPSGRRGHEIATLGSSVVDTGAESTNTHCETHPTERGKDFMKSSDLDAPKVVSDDGGGSKPPDIAPPTNPLSDSPAASLGEESFVLVKEGVSSLPPSVKSAGEGVASTVEVPAQGKKVVDGERGTSEVADLQQSKQIEELQKELLESRHMLEVREKKLVTMSQELIDLMETNEVQKGELGVLRAGQSGLEDMREEFAKRIAVSEKKLQAVVKERDSLKKQLTALSNEQTQQKRTEGEEMNKVLKEKDEQIAQLMEEGEKLSKQELQSNGIIKKLRLKERQNDQLLSAQRQQVEDLEGKVKNFKDQLKKKEENEKKYQESMAQLNTIAEQQALELTNIKTNKEGLLERVRSLQTNLDNSYKELAELQKANAVTATVAQQAAATAARSKEEEATVAMEQQRVVFNKEKEALILQIEELRMSVSRAEQQLAWREDHMKQEVADVQKRLQEAEDRNQELTSTISQATKPLLRQIENLQSAHSAQSANWEKVETSLTQRLVDTQAQLNVVLEKERSAVEKEMTLKSRVSALETQLSNTRQEKSQLLATVELERAKLETLEESQHRESSKLEALRASYQQSMDELRKEKEMLERQLEYERVRLEAESRKACLESQEKERLRSQLANSLSSINRSVSRQSSIGSQGEFQERASQGREYHRTESSSSEVPYLGTHSKAGSASAFEHLQSLLKQREGELANMQTLSSSLERSRSAMAEDFAKLSAQNEVLSQQVEKIPFLEQELEAVKRKHEAILQMYGEKAEEAEELKLDIQDLKSMYRQQIDELVARR